MLKTALVIDGDSSAARAALGDLDNSLRRSEQGAQLLGGSVRGAGAAATSMAAQAQASARAASGMATGFQAATGSIQNANIVAMELTHVTRNVAAQLAMGVSPARAFSMEIGRIATALQYSGGIKSLITNLSLMAGVIKVTTDAEAAQEAAAASAAAAALRGSAQQAAAAITAADTEVALAEAAVRAAVTAEAETAAQTRLAAALEAVTAASAESAIAQDALSIAEGRAAKAGEAASAATVTSIGATGVALGVLATIAGVAYGAIRKFQDQVKSSGELDRYRASLGLTHAEMLKLDDGVEKVSGGVKKLGSVTLSTGDVMAGLWKTIADQAANSAGAKMWDAIKTAAASACDFIIKAWAVTSAGITAGIYGTYNAVKVIWGNFAKTFGDLFIQGANLAIGALNGLVKAGVDGINALISGANARLHTNIGTIGAPQMAPVANPYASAATATAKAIGDGYVSAYSDARKADAAFWAQVEKNAIAHREKSLKDQANAIIAGRAPTRTRKQSDHGLQDSLDQLDAQAKGQLDLAKAYGVSDAAVIQAIARQKALEDAIRHKGDVEVFYNKEVAAELAKRAADGAKELSDLQFEISARKQANDAVESGKETLAGANQQLSLETTLRPLVAAAALAEGKAKEQLLADIRGLTKATNDNNAELAREQYLREKASNDNDIEHLRLEATLIGRSTKERAVAIAQLEEMQKLRDIPGLTMPQALYLMDQATEKAQLSVKSPFQEWLDTVPQTTAAVNEAIDKVKIEGLQQLNSDLADAIMGAKSLGQVFHDVAGMIVHDLLQIAIQQEIIKPLASSLFGGVETGATDLLAGTPYSSGGGILGLIGRLFGGGRASGGPVSPGNFYAVNERSTAPGLFIPLAPGVIQPPANDGAGRAPAPSVVEVHLLAGEYFDARVKTVSGNVAATVSRQTAQEAVAGYDRIVGDRVKDHLARRG